jgi:hypothetical protein
MMQKVVVLEHGGVVADRDGKMFRVRVWARAGPARRWSGILEFLPMEQGAAMHTGIETTQPSSAAIARWATTLGPLYFEGALERAQRRSGAELESKPLLVYRHEDVVEHDGRIFRPSTWAKREASGSFVAWIEFVPTDGAEGLVATGHETSQSDLEAVEYWACGLSAVYLEGALTRARSG